MRHEFSQNMIAKFWQEFLDKTGQPESTKYYEVFHFELTEKLANHLLGLVLCGKKRATASSLWALQLQNERLPDVGEFSIVTDWQGIPACVIQTVAIKVIPFSEITYEICRREGEDDSLENWRQGHRRFYHAEGKDLGYEFTEEMPVVFEDFIVVYQTAPAGE
jgi:uncharacterized protein YhfF